MAKSSGSLGPFFEGYREQTKKSWAQQTPRIPQAIDILDLFVETGVKSMTLLEISSQLMISKWEARKLAEELVARKLASIRESTEGGYLVELTKRGERFIKAMQE